MSAEETLDQRIDRFIKDHEWMRPLIDERKSLTDKLHAYEKQWTDIDTTIAHLRQENAELKAEVVKWKEDNRLLRVQINVGDKAFQYHFEDLHRHKAALEKCRECVSAFVEAVTDFDVFMALGGKPTPKLKLAGELAKALELPTSPNPQPTQDPV